MMKRPVDIAFRPERVLLPRSDKCCSYLLEVFELGDGPIDTDVRHGVRHAVWLHHLKVGGYRWKCSCGAERSHHALDAALVAEARTHFEQAWVPVAVPIWHPVAIWNDRAMKRPPPSTADLEKFANELAQQIVEELAQQIAEEILDD